MPGHLWLLEAAETASAAGQLSAAGIKQPRSLVTGYGHFHPHSGCSSAQVYTDLCEWMAVPRGGPGRCALLVLPADVLLHHGRKAQHSLVILPGRNWWEGSEMVSSVPQNEFKAYWWDRHGALLTRRGCRDYLWISLVQRIPSKGKLAFSSNSWETEIFGSILFWQ